MTIRLFEVGGSIRDELMGIDNPPDRDFCAESPEGWETLLAWCNTNMKKVFLVTPEFFTVRGMMPNGTAIDVVMCRKDGESSDGRHPDEVEPGTLMDDLERRDFTVNAMAREVNPETLEPIGEIIDPFSGRTHLEARSLRCVGITSARLEEDGLRVLRAARFAVTKDLCLDDTLKTCLQDPAWWDFVLKTVSVERIREELTKMFKFSTVNAIRFLTLSVSPNALALLGEEGSGIWLKPTVEKK
jgi:tRNA nucleotidyltransferase/poly(A) polymerase